MSKQLKTIALRVLGLFVAVVCVLGIYAFTQNPVTEQDAQAELVRPKLGIPEEVIRHKHTHEFDRGMASQPSGKVHSPIRVVIFPPAEVPEEDNTPVTVKAWIYKNDGNIGSLSYKWRLPEGVVSSDSLEGAITDLNAGETKEISLTIMGFSKVEKRNITLEAVGMREGVKLGASNAISSRPEDSMEFVAPIMADISPKSPTDSKFHK